MTRPLTLMSPSPYRTTLPLGALTALCRRAFPLCLADGIREQGQGKLRRLRLHRRGVLRQPTPPTPPPRRMDRIRTRTRATTWAPTSRPCRTPRPSWAPSPSWHPNASTEGNAYHQNLSYLPFFANPPLPSLHSYP